MFMDKCKILSWNIRDFSSSKNKCNLRSLVFKHDPSVVCIQESMTSQLVEKDLEFIWSHREAKAVFQPAVGHSGGILLVGMQNCLNYLIWKVLIIVWESP